MSEQIDTLSSIAAALGLTGHCRRCFCGGVPCGLSRCRRPRVQPLLLHVDGRVANGRTADELILVCLGSTIVAVSRSPIRHVSKSIHQRLGRIVLRVQGWSRIHLVLEDEKVGLGVGCAVAVCVTGAAHYYFTVATLPRLRVCVHK